MRFETFKSLSDGELFFARGVLHCKGTEGIFQKPSEHSNGKYNAFYYDGHVGIWAYFDAPTLVQPYDASIHVTQLTLLAYVNVRSHEKIHSAPLMHPASLGRGVLLFTLWVCSFHTLTNQISHATLKEHMSTLTPQPNNPLHGITLKTILEELVTTYGWEGLGSKIKIKCFVEKPSINSSLTFLRKTPWAREKVEDYYFWTFYKRDGTRK